ncbi:Uncharacterized protein YebE, UPF0316 family [Thermanaeromonas toyohensis ToBE]|uniref:UPF0316 protein SAMN00808754_0268 n=1 Tax=Thermanaeromonas toyohensis ToBE TaxID=698762 RepID=A0A1W1VA64_9FIRM|nr:DUF5698 domain-containing protein [Thermanaeromonas toyohensis]SMB90248.1 Uncharacterized protein YebE, UPF0316 family [Thermanaeromonas toyohensis ToBE]
MLSLFTGYLLIFLARVTDVTLATLRVLFVVRGKRFYAAGLGFIEVIIWVASLKFVMEHLTDPISVIFYALGFATGNIVGSYIEEKVALGQVSVQIITLHKPLELVQHLRDAGYGVTVTQGYGKEGIHPILHLSLPRRRLAELQEFLGHWDAQAFVVVQEIKNMCGGFYGCRKNGK